MAAPGHNPRSDSFNARVRGTSHIDFKTATTGVAAKAMRNEMSQLVATVEDPITKKVRYLNPFISSFLLFASLDSRINHKNKKNYDHRRSTPKCNHSSSSSLAISPSVH